MSIVKQKSEGKGSLRDIQILINEHPEILNALIQEYVSLQENSNIKWLSPLKKDSYNEYRDDDFIEKLEIDLKKVKLKDFWPRQGPQWDALGKSDNGIVFLVEAKANIPEISSPGTKASTISKQQIVSSLGKTKEFFGIVNDIDWSGKYYQYTNRLAHLYFLKELNDIPTYLLNIYFINDKEVKGPKSKEVWQPALDKMKTYLGATNHKLSDNCIDLFIDVEEFRK